MSMPEHNLILSGTERPAFSPHDYAMQVIDYCARTGRLGAERQNLLRTTLSREAAKRAEQFTAGRSTTVTRQQAEAFYASVFCQLDAALLMLESDDLAVDAVATMPFAALLEAGAKRIMALYDEAKEHFRTAYALTKPVQTSFFHDLLRGFERFSTKYDARFHVKDAQKYVDFCYPLLSGKMPDADGIFAVHAYYRALHREGEFLQCFPEADVQTLMQRYAARFLTSPAMIAENIAELVFRHWIAGVLTDTADGVLLPEHTADDMIAEFSGRSTEDLADAMQKAVRMSPLTQDSAEMQAYLLEAVPSVAAAMYPRIAEANLSGWFA